MAAELQGAGFELIEKRPDKKRPDKDVYVFERNNILDTKFEKMKIDYQKKKMASRLNFKEIDFIIDKLTGQESKKNVDINRIVQKLIGYKENKKNV